MKTSVYTKIFVALLVVFGALALISYSRSKYAATQEECSGPAKSCSKKVQSEFLTWESFSKNLLSGDSWGDDN
jgi:hypothetical protein